MEVMGLSFGDEVRWFRPVLRRAFGGHVVTVEFSEVAVLVTDQLLDLLGDFTRLTNQTENQVHELVRGIRRAGSAQRGALVVVAFHCAKVAVAHPRRSEPRGLKARSSRRGMRVCAHLWPQGLPLDDI
jgi:hypothetical protein